MNFLRQQTSDELLIQFISEYKKCKAEMEYLQKMKDIQNNILEFLDSDEEDQKLFDNLKKLLTFQQEEFDFHELK